MKIFAFDDYRRFLNEFIDASKKQRGGWTFSKLAEAARINRSYLSQVLSGVGNLSADQAFLLARALSLPDEDTEYFVLLVEIERCQVAARRTQLKRQRDGVRRKHQEVKNYLREEFLWVTELSKEQYYRDSYATLVHMYLTIPRYVREPAAIARDLAISPERLRETLDLLETCGVVTQEADGRYALRETLMHLDKGSPLMRTYGSLFRMKAIEMQQKGTDQGDCFLNIAFSADVATRARLKADFLEYFRASSLVITDAPCDDVFVMNFDLFKV